MRKLLYPFVILVLCSHDLYLKMDSYFLQPNQKATLSLYNGTFEKSENIITRDRIIDASVIARGERNIIKADQWKDQDSTISQLPFTTGNAGTYVVGVATKARNIELTADKFNDYLRHDGVLDMLDQRAMDSTLNQDAVESYEKHVKAIYQVGDSTTDDWRTELEYPIEFVPMENPYEKYSGETLQVQLLLDGEPLSNQLVYADYLHTHDHDDHSTSHRHDGQEHSHDHEHSHDNRKHSHNSDTPESHTHTKGQQLRTDEQGNITIDLPEDGIYYLRTIYMTKVSDDPVLTHKSKWATLTFEVTHRHGSDTHTHDDHHQGLPTWIFIVGSILLIGVLFLMFRKKN